MQVRSEVLSAWLSGRCLGTAISQCASSALLRSVGNVEDDCGSHHKSSYRPHQAFHAKTFLVPIYASISSDVHHPLPDLSLVMMAKDGSRSRLRDRGTLNLSVRVIRSKLRFTGPIFRTTSLISALVPSDCENQCAFKLDTAMICSPIYVAGSIHWNNA